MKNDSLLGSIMYFAIFLLFVGISNAKPLDYKDVENLLPTEPQTTNDTLAAIVRDPVVQDAVQNAVGNGSLEGLVVKKKVLVMPATEPTKVVSQREQILVVPMTHLEDVRKNITETVNAATDVDGLTSTDVQSFTENDEDGYTNSEGKDISSYTSQRDDFYEVLTETFKTTQKPFGIDNIPQEIPYLMPNPSQGIASPEHSPSTISVPIIAFFDPAKISDDKIDVPIAAALSRQDEVLKNHLENGRDVIQRNVQNYVDESSWTMNPNNWQLPSSSEMEVSSSLYEPSTKQTKYINDINTENSLPVTISRVDIVRPLFWTSDADINYSTDPHDMEVAADIVFRPLFRYRQEVQRRTYRKPTYQRYNRYNSYPRRNYRYRPRYSDDYY
ncbi:uncharacterized protein LOC105832033 [Monomorium pharaonis]|uniref:uncharacterized protein LOC105832033 n=1 Tax=Monomorium pharaonis TaxID=307658 RepID=UPI00063FB164|nr:uncharacterized protein LOC105832033 [Monomorium pharaonis]